MELLSLQEYQLGILAPFQILKLFTIMQKLFENWRKYINEYGAAGMGSNIATLAGAGRVPMPSVQQDYKGVEFTNGEDIKKSCKAVIYRTGKVLLLKNEKGWDLPGGHMKQGESVFNALKREVFEETGLTILNPTNLNYSHGNKNFFSLELPTDDIKLSDEHSEYGFFSLQDIPNMNNVADFFKEAIYRTLGMPGD